MNDKLNEHINSVIDNISILPIKTKSDQSKYISYINDNLKEYNKLKSNALDEIYKRYNEFTITPINSEINSLEKAELDIDLIRLNHSRINMLDRLNLDYLLYKLSHYYKDDLDNINKIILEIIAIFKKMGITLSSDDFNYTIYVNNYMKVLLSNYNNKNMIHNTFNTLYWKCPYIITEIALNFRYLIFKYYKKLNALVNDNNGNKLIKDYQDKIIHLEDLKRTDYGYLVNSLLNKEINFNDYSDTNINKIKNNLLLEIDNPNNCHNLIDLLHSLNEYSEYLNYQYIVDDFKKLLTEIPTYKGLYEAKLKEISKEESKLFGYNKKINNSGLFKIKQDKINELLIKENDIIDTLDKLYKELDDLLIKKEIYLNSKNAFSIYDILKLASCDYNYFAKLCKVQDENVTISTINEKLFDLRSFIIKDHFNIINNINSSSNINIAQMIADRYKLVNINISEESISIDNIDNTKNNVNTLISYYDLFKVNLSYDNMKFIMNSKKILEDEKILIKK